MSIEKSNEQLLNERLKQHGLTIGGMFPGTNPNATREEVCGEMLKAVDELVKNGIPEDA